MWIKKGNYIVETTLLNMGIKHFITNSNAGDMKNINERSAFLSENKIAPLITCEQVHGNRVREVKRCSKQNAILDVDGLFTKKKDLSLGIFTADCVPIFVVHKKNKFTGLLHAGWRGTKEEILKNFVRKLVKEYDPKDILCIFGPYLKSCCYEVKKDLDRFFDLKEKSVKGVNKYFLNLYHENKKQLDKLGLKNDNIIDSNFCTSCNNKDFFSYRINNMTNKRMLGVIEL